MRAVASTVAVAMAITMVVTGTDAARADDIVVFTDSDLLVAINAFRGEAPATPITVTEAAAFAYLNVSGANVDSLGGIERFTALEILYADQNAIVDVRPLASLPVLQYASIGDQTVALPSIATTATQANPLRAANAQTVTPSSATAAIAANGASWRLTTPGAHVLTWDLYTDVSTTASYWFSGTMTQTATGLGQLAQTPVPTISGTLRAGSVLTATPGTWDAGVSFGYQWLSNGTPIAGAKSRTLTLAPAQANTAISVRVTGSKDGFAPVTKTSASTLKVMLAPTPVITGTARFGQKLTAKTGTWTAGASLALQWYADKVAIPGATKSTFTVTSTQQGKKIHLRVTGTKSGWAKIGVNSAVTSEVRLLDMKSKASVKSAYKKILAPALKVATGWTGKTSTCKVGAESSASRVATMNAVNFVRAMNQLDGVRFESSWINGSMRNSLLMEARNQITHYPSKSGKCWSSAAATAAARSNLAIMFGSAPKLAPTTGARAVVGYMTDEGPSNFFAGHRRWLINPLTTAMATGSTKRANTLMVMGSSGPVTSAHNAQPTWMEWPAAGYFPKQLEPKGLWSLSASSAVDFRSAKVKVVGPGGKVYKTTKQPVYTGYGPNTMTWRVAGLSKPSGKKTAAYTVTVTGIKGASVTSYTYKVTLFDPNG